MVSFNLSHSVDKHLWKKHPYLYSFSLILKKQNVAHGAKIQPAVSGTFDEELDRWEEEKQKKSSGKT